MRSSIDVLVTKKKKKIKKCIFLAEKGANNAVNEVK